MENWNLISNSIYSLAKVFIFYFNSFPREDAGGV